MKEYDRDIFEHILNEMRLNMEETKEFWGRYFGEYCEATISDDRYNSFNTRSSVETLEFRLLKFINAKQYIRACDFCIWVTRYINYHIKKESFNSVSAKKVGSYILKKYKEVLQQHV